MTNTLKEVFEHIDKPEYRALLVFSSRDRAQSFAFEQLKAHPDATYQAPRMIMAFPSGARVQLSALEHASDYHRFAGCVYQFICFADPIDDYARAYIAAGCRSRNAEIPAKVCDAAL
jgi:hypothetical protein